MKKICEQTLVLRKTSILLMFLDVRQSNKIFDTIIELAFVELGDLCTSSFLVAHMENMTSKEVSA